MRCDQLFPTLVVVAIGLFVPGCSTGPNLGTVSGVVSQDGIPIPYVLVQFQPVEPRGTYASAYTDVSGHYELRFSQTKRGALVGRHEATLRTSKRDEIQIEDKSTGLMVTPTCNGGDGSGAWNRSQSQDRCQDWAKMTSHPTTRVIHEVPLINTKRKSPFIVPADGATFSEETRSIRVSDPWRG